MDIAEELENYSRQNSEKSQNLIKGINTRLYSSLDIRDPFSSGPEMNLNKWTKEQEN